MENNNNNFEGEKEYLNALNLFKEAFSSELEETKRKEITELAIEKTREVIRLGLEYEHYYFAQNNLILLLTNIDYSKKLKYIETLGLDNIVCSKLKEATQLFEFLLDADSKNRPYYFSKYENRDVTFRTIEDIWTNQAKYIAESESTKKAGKYLFEKRRKVHYLKIDSMPLVLYYMGVFDEEMYFRVCEDACNFILSLGIEDEDLLDYYINLRTRAIECYKS
jgi:hypothetical protein